MRARPTQLISLELTEEEALQLVDDLEHLADQDDQHTLLQHVNPRFLGKLAREIRSALGAAPPAPAAPGPRAPAKSPPMTEKQVDKLFSDGRPDAAEEDVRRSGGTGGMPETVVVGKPPVPAAVEG